MLTGFTVIFMLNIKIKKGYQLRLAGAPRGTLHSCAPGVYIGLSLKALTSVKPRLLTQVGQQVKIGEPLFVDKNNPHLQFMAPAAGEITEISFGPRRTLEQIVIRRAVQETAVSFPMYDSAALAELLRTEIVQAIVDGGLWYLLRELPFRQGASIIREPSRIFVTLDSLVPYQPNPQVYLNGQDELFRYGLTVLRKLCCKPPTLIIAADNVVLAERFAGEDIIGFKGMYPAHDPGVLLYHSKKSAAENYAWYIDGQDLLQIAELLRDGVYPSQRIYAVSGVPVPNRHVKARIGGSVAEITAFSTREHWRVLAGSVFNGYLTSPEAFAGPLDKSFLVINDGNRQGKFVAWMLFGVKAASSFRTFLSAWLPRRKRALNCNMHGGLRSCISCNQCAKLCPLDILPNLMWKALLVGETDEALTHGLLDCVECGLCSYGCPAKIELMEAFIKAKADFHKETAC